MRNVGRVLVAVLFSLGIASWVAAVDLTAGNSSISGDTGYVGTGIDLNHPSTATGTLTSVRFGWPAACAVKIKIFHRAGNTLTLAAEQTVTGSVADFDLYTAPLSPPLPIRQGDLIGIGNAEACGGVLFDSTPFAGTFVYLPGVDATGSFAVSDASVHSGGVVVSGTGTTTEYRAGTIPGVGSGPGLNGANFKTSLQMIAPVIGADVTGRLVFHPAGTGGSVDDPSIDIFIARGHSLSFADVVPAMGQTGFGTLDVVVAADSTIPVTLARIYNDQGSAGSSGLGEEMVAENGPFSSSGQIVSAGFTGYLSAPVDPSKTRLNIGVRTLDSGAFVSAELKDSSGNLKATAQSAFPPNFFNQFHAEQLFGMDLAPNDIIEVSVSTGTAIVFGAATDNVTNDPSAQFVHPVFGVL